MALQVGGGTVKDSVELVELYRVRVERLGFCGRTMFYASEDAYTEKLCIYAAALSRHIPRGASVLDLGCGYGELLRYYTPTGCYTGVDMVPEFLAEASLRHPDREFVLCDFLSTRADLNGDWVVLAGVLSSVPDPMALLRAASGAARSGLICDITLAERLPAEFKELNRFDAAEVLRLLGSVGLEVTEVEDVGASWVLLVASFDKDRRKALV